METQVINEQQNNVRKSIVKVFFPARGSAYAYYNDSFDLQVGDMVYVEGKLEGLPGRVTEINYKFKIRPSAYKRVIAKIDTAVHGTFYVALDHCVTFQRGVLSPQKVSLWFTAPLEDDDYVVGYDDSSFPLNDLDKMNVSQAIGERGVEYYKDNKVRYICLDGTHGCAIVEGSEYYEVEFDYKDGIVSNLLCPCYCTGYCKHDVAVMLQLKETLDIIAENYAAQYAESDYFSAINKCTLYAYALDGKQGRNFEL